MFNFFQGAGRPAAPRGPFRTRLRVFSVGCKDREDLECGDKILLPSSALETLVQLEIAYPMMFRLTNPETGLLVHCGVLEFVAEEGHCYIPYWMMSHLAVDEGGVVELLNVDLPKGTFVQFQPHSYTFNELSNPRAVLERGLRGYAVLNKGTTIPITHVNRTFHLDVALLEPADAVLIIETDINVDFAEAKDYAKRKQQLDAEKRARAAALPPTPASSGSSSLSGAAAPSFATHTPTSAPMFEFGKRLPTASGLGSPAPGAGSGAASPFAGTGSVLGTGASSGSAVGAGAGAGGALTLATSGLGSGASSAMGTPTIPASGTAAGGGGYFARLGAGHSLKAGPGAVAAGSTATAAAPAPVPLGGGSGGSSAAASPWGLNTPVAGSAPVIVGQLPLSSPPPTASALPASGGYTLGTGAGAASSSLSSSSSSSSSLAGAVGGHSLGGDDGAAVAGAGGLTKQVIGQWVFYRDAGGRLIKREPLSQQAPLAMPGQGHTLK